MLRRILIFVSAFLQLGLALSPFIPYVRDNIWAPQTSVSGFAASLATYVGVQFACLAALVYLLLEDFKSQAKSDIHGFGELLHQYTPLHVRQLRENEFYQDFLGHCVSATYYVNICYFSPRPPEIGGSPERIQYYANIAAVMRNNPNTRFRRIVRDTPLNRAWALQLVSELQGTNNCSVAMLPDLEETVEMARALSVQIVDGKITWLVAIAEHGGAELHRDIAIENPEVTAMLNKYFDRLWRLSRIIFEPGYDFERSRNALNEGM